MIQSKSLIHLKVCDIPDPALDKFLRPLTTYFSEPKTHIILKDFCLFLSQTAKWSYKDILNNFEVEKQSFVKQYEIRNIQIEKMLGYLERSIQYGVSISHEKFHEVRGKLFEVVLVGLHGGVRRIIVQPKKMGWGVCLKVPSEHSKPIEFIDKTITGKNNKKTFDFAYLGKMNFFYECKISPNGLGVLEIGYFREVQKYFEQYSLPLQICFFSSDNSFATEYALSKFVELDTLSIVPLGYDIIVDFIQKY